jgi:hypothetical protein
MKVTIVDSDYSHSPIRDIPEEFLILNNPLYIGARDGQVYRVHQIIDGYKGVGNSIGWWELHRFKYITEDGKINFDKFDKHDGLFIANPDRVHEAMKETYFRLINELEKHYS